MAGTFDEISQGLMEEVAATDEDFRKIAKKLSDKEAIIYLHQMAHRKEMEIGNAEAMKAFRRRRTEIF